MVDISYSGHWYQESYIKYIPQMNTVTMYQTTSYCLEKVSPQNCLGKQERENIYRI